MIDTTVRDTGPRVNSILAHWARPGLALLMVMILVGSSEGVFSLEAQDDPGIARLELKYHLTAHFCFVCPRGTFPKIWDRHDRSQKF